jgi:hypothetical protein
MKPLLQMKRRKLAGGIIDYKMPHKYNFFVGLQETGISTNTKINP